MLYRALRFVDYDPALGPFFIGTKTITIMLSTSKCWTQPTRQLLGLFSSLTIMVSLSINIINVDEIFGIRALFILVFVFGLTTIPLYSICAVHANNLTQTSEMASLSASLIFIYAVGAIISPVLAGYLIEVFGADSMFLYFATLHIVLLCFTGYRAVLRPDIAPKYPYLYTPRTSLFIAKTISSLKRRR